MDNNNSEHLTTENFNHNPRKDKKYGTIKNYLEVNLYPSLEESIKILIEHIKNKDNNIEADLITKFNSQFYTRKNEEKTRLKKLFELERGDDYSETDFNYYKKNLNGSVDESKSENKEADKDIDFDVFGDYSEDDLEEVKKQVIEQDETISFNAVKFLAATLRKLANKENLNSKKDLHNNNYLGNNNNNDNINNDFIDHSNSENDNSDT